MSRPAADGQTHGAAERSEVAPGGGATAAFGLVPSSTSDTRTHLVQLDREGSRYRRLRRNVLTTARLLRDSTQQDGFRSPYMAMLTLTYGPGADWAPHHITDLNKCIREWLKRQGHDYAYIWVCELQKRGAPHYHVLIFIPYGVRLPKADKRGWWPYGMSNIQAVHKPIGYLIKYLSKTGDELHRFAKGQRTHGSGGLKPEQKIQRRWWLAPGYVRQHWPEYTANVAPAKGGGWVSRVTGEHIPSPWVFCGLNALGAVVRWIGDPDKFPLIHHGAKPCAP